MDKFYRLSAAPRIKPMLLLFVLLLSFFCTFASDNQHMIPLTLQGRIRAAEMVVEGEVVSKQSFWDAQHKNIYTSNIIRVYKVFKGEVRSEQVELITEGGTIGLKIHAVSTALQLRPGQQGVFFLKRQQQLPQSPGNQHISTMAYGSQQGFVKYDITSNKAFGAFDSYNSVRELYQNITAQTGQSYHRISENEALDTKPDVEQRQQQTLSTKRAPIITGFEPTTISAGTGTTITINGSGFGATRGDGAVEFRDADFGGTRYVRPLPSAYILWSDNQIVLNVPSASLDGGTPGSGPIQVVTDDGDTFTSDTQLFIEFAYSNVAFDGKTFRPRLVNRNGKGGYSVRFAPSMQNRPAAQEGFQRAMATWSCVSGVNWEVGAPTTIESAEDDGEIVVRFAPNNVVGDSVLARTISYYEGCIGGANQDTVWYLTEFDMEINSDIAWQYGPGSPVGRQFDFETVMLHELGHAHQLSHVIMPSAIMHYAIEFRRVIRDLSTADIVGANLVVENSVGENICEPPMELNEDTGCSIRALTVFPNPVDNNTITLIYTVTIGNTTLQAQLYDMAGRLVRAYDITFSDTNLPVVLDVSELAAGIYILKWQERDRGGQVKLLKR
ncbi:T9SS type A sorting domain-containing protein [Pontibacter pamirensis]|uniref:T9SS type A sorting domain-containing protein n=1 Tax=Pontibacter pamirensis TaxID=2562824 RepID=UPI001389EA9E|nr:T9SS type A sorting domain-containing protein [Pontibacter pamirensis]